MTVFELAAYVARREGLRFLVIGGHAVNAFGYSRDTADLDLLICRDDRERWLGALTAARYNIYHDGGNFLQLTPPEGSWPIDLMLVNEQTFAGMLQESIVLEAEPTKPSIPSAEHLIALKLHALKHGPLHRFGKDLQDIIGIIEHQKLDPHSEKMRQLFQKYGNMELYEQVARSFG